MQALQPNTTLQGGKYKILKMLCQGGFGITYLAEQTMLERKVAIKEFFIRDFCNRREGSCNVTLCTESSRETVKRFREKFLKEARNIAKLSHPNIVRIIEVFEENGTAYYVMEYCEHGTLADKVKNFGYLSESVATRYILQVAEALEYIHQRKMNHLDVKPANIMLNEKDESVLIDFGLSKQYDAGGQQTSTTPVGISEGYAPMEQYKKGGVGEFSPQTDIYALGATFFKLLTGKTPQSASDILNYGVRIEELKDNNVSQKAIDTICNAMKSCIKDRTKNVCDFIESLQGETALDREIDDEATLPTAETKKAEEEKRQKEAEAKRQAEKKAAEQRKAQEEAKRKREEKIRQARKESRNKYIMWSVIAVIAIAIACVGGYFLLIYTNNTTDNAKLAPHPEDKVVNSITSSKVSSIWVNDNQIDIYTINGVSFEMIRVEGGTFTMGATEEQGADAYSYEKPAHQVTVSDYFIGKTEVTQALWVAVMGKNPSYNKGEELPVEQVSWDNCQEFIKKLNASTGKKFRLPTEAEWEYAARGGSKSRGYKYSGSDNIDDVAWHSGVSDGKTHEVGTKSPNELGIFDMSGNVWEWCSDWYGNYSSSNAQINPKGASDGYRRVDRGGSWMYNARLCRSSARSSFDLNCYSIEIGFRLCLSE